MCAAIFPSPAFGSGREIFSPNLPNNLLRTPLALIQIGVRWIQKIFLPKVFHTWGTNVFAFTEISFESITDGIFRSQLGPSWELFRCIFRNVEENKSSPVGSQLCRFSFGVVRILVQKEAKEIYTKLITTCEDGKMNRKSIVSIKLI
jgi:hypothetical protein